MLRDTLFQIAKSYGGVRLEELRKHSFAKWIKEDAVIAVKHALASNSDKLIIEGSSGGGQWADIPWITIMDPRVTDSPTRGYYVVYLFNWRRQKIVLSLNQGSTQVQQEHGVKRNAILTERANRMRSRSGPLKRAFSYSPISLTASTRLGKSYEPGHAIGKTYDADNLPTEEHLIADLSTLIYAYRNLFLSGGTDPELTEDDYDAVTDERPQARTVTEMRVYRAHRSIERRPGNSSKVKNVHGYTCQACQLSFECTYGKIGQNYIEAHHLIPLATLETGVPTEMDVKTQFCVLCANCHRMIHRQDDPSDLNELRARIVLKK